MPPELEELLSKSPDTNSRDMVFDSSDKFDLSHEKLPNFKIDSDRADDVYDSATVQLHDVEELQFSMVLAG